MFLLKSTLFLLIAIFTFETHAKWTGPGLSGSNRSSSSLKFRFLGGLKYQHATFGSKDESVEKRKLNGVGLDAVAGMSWGFLVIGVGAEYTKLYQMTDPEDVNDTNLSGTMTNFSGVGGFAFGNFLLLGRYYFKSSFDLEEKSSAGDSVEYNTPKGSYNVSLYWRPGGRSYWCLDYTGINFSAEDRNGTSTNFSSEETMNLSSIGLSYGLMF